MAPPIDRYLKKYNKNFYKTYAWKKKRRDILDRDNRECQECKKHGKVSRATVVHHVKEYKFFPSLALNDENLESLCRDCHEAKHPDRLKNFEFINSYHGEKWE